MVAAHFGGNQHGSHGRRINRDEAKQQQVLTLYHLSTIAFEMGPAAKSVVSSNGKLWIKNLQMEVVVQPSAQA